MNERAAERIRRLLGGPELEPLIRRLDRRLAKRPLVKGHVMLTDASAETREAVTSLLGLPPKPNGSIHVKLESLDEVIRQSGAAAGLSDAITILLGRPPRHPAVEKRRGRTSWNNALVPLVDGCPLSPEVSAYLRQICHNGVLRRASGNSLEQGTKLLRQLVECAAALPLDEATPLPLFAAQQLGDAHALDVDRPLCSLLLRTITKMVDQPVRVTEERHRNIWSQVNIVLDELSSTVLVLNLPVADDGLVGRMLAEHTTAGEPCRLTFRHLRLDGLPLAFPLPPIHVCENPSILAVAAERLRDRCRPLICVEGQPSHAATLLLRQLKAAGAELLYHGDFDRSGLQIASQMMSRFGAKPWRMSAADYAARCDEARLPLGADVPETPWDPGLRSTLESQRKVLLEETVAEELLKDLRIE